MGAVILTGAQQRHYNRDPGSSYTNEKRVTVHWDGVANRKQHTTMADGVVWVNLSSLVRDANLGFSFHVLNGGAANVAVAGSMTNGRIVDQINSNTAAAVITAENSNFVDIDATLTTGQVANTTTLFSLARITFTVGTPATVIITCI